MTLDLTVIAEDWVDHALCAQTDPEAFFPEKGGSTRAAKAVCGRCPVKTECLNFALANVERFGIWGGASERERRRLFDTIPAAIGEAIESVFLIEDDFYIPGEAS